MPTPALQYTIRSQIGVGTLCFVSRSNVIRDALVNLNGFALLNVCTPCLVFMGFPDAAAGVTGAFRSRRERAVRIREHAKCIKPYVL